MSIRESLFRLMAAGLLCCVPLDADAQEGAAQPLRRVSVDYGHTRFDADLTPWHVVTLEGLRRSPAGTLVVRGNLARRFSETGHQLEVDSYPRLTSRTYALLSAGYSPSEIFPTWKYGAELFGDIGRGVELSAGARRMDFRDVRVALYSASAGKYAGSYYASVRPTVASTSGGNDLSGDLLLRRYFRDETAHVTLRVGAGSAAAEQTTLIELDRLSARRLGLDGVVPVIGGLGVRWSVVTELEKLRENRQRNRFGIGIGAQASF